MVVAVVMSSDAPSSDWRSNYGAYRGEFQDKIPMNNSGFAPAIVPSMGYCINRFCSEFVLFGTAGFLITLGVTLP